MDVNTIPTTTANHRQAVMAICHATFATKMAYARPQATMTISITPPVPARAVTKVFVPALTVLLATAVLDDMAYTIPPTTSIIIRRTTTAPINIVVDIVILVGGDAAAGISLH
jgi:hypothetical protein